MTTQVEIVKKASAPDTLKKIKVGKTVIVKTRDLRESVIRSAVCRLNKVGYHFIVTGHGLIDEIKITRTK